VNRAVNTAAAEQRRVRSVDDRGYVLARDISHDHQNTSAKKRF
jgi:hypothetical protein